jgi:DNA modification methylase
VKAKRLNNSRRVAKVLKKAATPPKLEIHPLAENLPPLSVTDYAALKDNCVLLGRIRDPIVLLDGKILDGRHRYRVHQETGLPFTTEDFDPKRHAPTPIDYVYSNAVGRNMSDSQKAAAAVGLLDEFAKAAAARQKATQFGSGGGISSTTGLTHVNGMTRAEWQAYLTRRPKSEIWAQFKSEVLHDENARYISARSDEKMIAGILESLFGPTPSTNGNGKSREQAAALFGVSDRYVQDAKLVRDHDAKLFRELFEGRTTVTVARAHVRRALKRADLAKRVAANGHNIGDAPAWEIITGDALNILPTFARRRFRLIAWDPQYNEGVDYGRGPKADRLSDEDYETWFHLGLDEAAELLAEDGSLVVIINDKWAAEYVVYLKKKLKLHHRGWIKWYETFGVNCTDNFNRTSRHILYFTKSPTRYVFNRDAFSRKSARQVVYNDSRAVAAGKIWDDVWAIPRLVDNAKERMADFPTQIPEDVMRPIVAGFTEPGDEVLDFSSGSGTTIVAAVTQGRRAIGVEISKHYAAESRLRVKAAIADMAAAADRRAK